MTFPLAGGQGPSNAPIERLGRTSGFPDERDYFHIGWDTVNNNLPSLLFIFFPTIKKRRISGLS